MRIQILITLSILLVWTNSLKVSDFLPTILLVLTNSLKVSDFLPSLFKFTSIQQGFRNIQTGNDRVGQIMIFTDLDGDRFTDYIAIQTRNTSQLLFYIWDNSKEQFDLYKRNIQWNQTDLIQEIISYDINQDGQSQLIITTKNTLQGQKFTTILATVTCVQCTTDLIVNINSQVINQTAVPFLIENEDNGNARLFTIQGNSRIIYDYSFSSETYTQVDFKSILNSYSGTVFNPVLKHFASIIDLNNDCVADLMIVSFTNTSSVISYNFQFYEKQSNNNYQQKFILKGNTTGQIDRLDMVTFSDIDNSGSIDLVFFYKVGNQYHLKALLNSFTPEQICQTNSMGLFPYMDFDITSLPNISIPQQYNLSSNSIPHFNDVNADGNPDILTMLELNGFTKVAILINKGNLQFYKYEDQWRSYDLNNPSQTLFYDFGEDGKMDIIIMSEQKKISNNVTIISSTRTSLINNLQSDTLHLKIMPLSITSQYNQAQNMIQNAFGVTTQWLFTDIDGNKLVKTSNQLFQFNYGLLQLPYAYSGLGRTNNYVEELTVGYQSYGQREDWTPIIPNSQLMVYKETGMWKLETLLKNNERVNDVIYVSLLILLCMGAVIFYLNYKEAQEDKRDHYNFIQLIR